MLHGQVLRRGRNYLSWHLEWREGGMQVFCIELESPDPTRLKEKWKTDLLK